MSADDMGQLAFSFSVGVVVWCWAMVFRPSWLLRLWNALKSLVRWPYEQIARKPEPVTLPDPDWAAAAEEVGFFDPLDHILLDVRAWTPEEREEFGVNETDRIIDAIQRELNGEEWRKLIGYRTIPLDPPSRRDRDTPTARAIRRNGQQITKSVLS